MSSALLVAALTAAAAQQSRAADAKALIEKIESELSTTFPPPDGRPDPTVPHGVLLQGAIRNSRIYPGTENVFQVFVPAQYDPAKPACFLLKLDGFSAYEGTVLDNLIARKEVPVLIGIGVVPGTVWKDPAGTPKRAAYRFNRSYEFDSVNDNFPNYVLDELLPAVQKMKTEDGRPIRLSPNGNDHAVTGGSTGGIGSFTLAWRRPDQFTRVYSVIGTFVSMRGGHEYPALVRKTDPKPLRIFLEDGSTDAWNPLFGSWYDANLNLESALTFSGYDVAHVWGTHGHNGTPGRVILPDVLRWLWRDYPAPIPAGISQNSTLQEVTVPGEQWRKVDQAFHSAAGLAADAKGDVYVSDAPAIYRLAGEGTASMFVANSGGVVAQGFGPDGTLYGAIPAAKRIVAITAGGKGRTVAEGVGAQAIVVTHDGAIFASEPGEHSDMPSRLWRIEGGRKKVVDEGLASASGIAFSPDAGLLFAAERTTKWVYSYIAQPDGLLRDKQRFFWLHMTDIPNDSGAEDMAVDTHGNLYVATRMGIQICDQNGRVRAILPLPTPSGPARSLCFGGPNYQTLYVTDGTQMFLRRMKVKGHAPWSAPIPVPNKGAG